MRKALVLFVAILAACSVTAPKTRSTSITSLTDALGNVIPLAAPITGITSTSGCSSITTLPGGMLLSLDLMAGEFFDRGFVYAESVDRGGGRHKLRALMLGSAHYRGRIAVLVGHVSASAAEIFAAMIQEQHRGTVVGHQTAGFVLSARMRSLPDGGMLEYSDRDLHMIDGRRLQSCGVTPDVVPPPPTLDDLRAGRDPDLEAAVRVLRHP